MAAAVQRSAIAVEPPPHGLDAAVHGFELGERAFIALPALRLQLRDVAGEELVDELDDGGRRSAFSACRSLPRRMMARASSAALRACSAVIDPYRPERLVRKLVAANRRNDEIGGVRRCVLLAGDDGARFGVFFSRE